MSAEAPPLEERETSLSGDALLAIHETMTLTRLVDRRLQALYRQGRMVGGVYSQEGNEGVSIGAAWAMAEADCLFPVHRGLGARLVRGDRLEVILAQLLGRAAGPTAGRDSGLHHDVPERRIFAMISPLGTQPSVACGAALALKQRGEEAACLVFTGDGSTALGEFHEGYNTAACLKLPVVVVVENNLYAFSTPNELEFACASLAERAAGYGTPGQTVDGTDVVAVFEAVDAALKRARAGEGPSLIEARALRLRGHSEADSHDYVPAEVMEAGRRKEPLARLEATLLARDLAGEDELAETRARCEERLAEALELASSLPEADPSELDWGRFSSEGHPTRGRDVAGTPGLAAERLPAPSRLPGDPRS